MRVTGTLRRARPPSAADLAEADRLLTEFVRALAIKAAREDHAHEERK